MGSSGKNIEANVSKFPGFIRHTSMVWMKIFFLAICLNLGTIHGTENYSFPEGELVDLPNEAVERGRQWIWNQRDPLTDLWPRGEVTTAIMGVLQEVIDLRGLKYGNRTRLEGKGLVEVKSAEVQNAQSKIVAQNIERVHLEFFKKLKNNGGEISEMGDDYLGQLAMVLGLTCLHDPKDYFGYNLIDELYNRAKTAMNYEGQVDIDKPEIQFPALVTVLCNLKDYRIVSYGGVGQFLHSMNAYPSEDDFGDNTELNLERAAMNMIALSCLHRANLEFDHDGEAKPLLQNAMKSVLLHNSEFINSVQEEDGGFDNVYSTALALHAQRQSPIVCCKNKNKKHPDFNEDLAINWLLEAQKPDGSFGSSITFTSLSGLGLASSHPLDPLQNIRSVECDGIWANKNKSKIAVEFSENVYSKMSFRESIPATIGDHIIVLLENFAEENPKTLKLKGSLFQDSYYQIHSINGIEDSDLMGTSWKAYRITSDGNPEYIPDLRDAEIEDMDDVYRFEFD